MLDKERILAKIDELDGYLREITEVLPGSFKEYKKTEKKRSCERLLQLEIECLIDLAKLFVKGLRLGVPSEENDLFKKLYDAKILSESALTVLRNMRGFRNILIHDYADVNDEIVFKYAKEKFGDFDNIRREFIGFLKK